MKKKILSILSVSVIFTLILAIGACAVTPRWSYLITVVPEIFRSSNEYGVTVSCDTDVSKIKADVTLYEKGLFGYSEKASYSKTIYNHYGEFTGNYTFSSSKKYKVEADITVTTSSGATESTTTELAE